MKTNQTLMQYFEWYLPNDGQHWNRLAGDAPHLAELGITQVWMPPAFKATNSNDVGYGIYDLFDLGEFDQKGTVRTKYGTKDEYIQAIRILKDHGISAMADLVLNHKAAADGLESFEVIEVDPEDRTKELTDPFRIKGWTHFSFPGRHGRYNDFQWHWYHFTGTDFDAKRNKNGIYQIVGDNKGWSDDSLVDNENGNYDYLMYADLDFKHPEVIQNLYDWANWFIPTTGISGFRLDAIKHIDSFFMKNFIRDIKENVSNDFYVFGEFWNPDEETNTNYLKDTDHQFDLVDVKLHYNFHKAGEKEEDFDLTTIFDGSLVKNHPESAVTFVENHDTQKGQALESVVADWFKPLAYGMILLRKHGKPCVFYGDYYGVQGYHAQPSFQKVLDKLLLLRKYLAFGEETDYFEDANTIGWTRIPDELDRSPLAVIISNKDDSSISMYVGTQWQGHVFADQLEHHPDTVTVQKDGWATFPVLGRSISAWTLQQSEK